LNSFNSATINNCCIQHKFVDIFINDTYIQVAVWVTKKVSKQYTLYVLLWIFTSYSTNFKQISQSKECYCKKKSGYWKKHNHRHAKKAMIWKCSNVKHNFIQHIKCFISTFKSSGGFHIKIIYSYWKKCHTNKNRSLTCFTGKYVCTGNENSKPIWNKFIIRKYIIETSQVELNFGRTVYIDSQLFLEF
jgi:hypothetical protein